MIRFLLHFLFVEHNFKMIELFDGTDSIFKLLQNQPSIINNLNYQSARQPFQKMQTQLNQSQVKPQLSNMSDMKVLSSKAGTFLLGPEEAWAEESISPLRMSSTYKESQSGTRLNTYEALELQNQFL